MPDRVDAYSLLGFCHYQLGNFEKAKSYYKAAVQMQPAFFWSNYNLGLIYFREGKYDRAIEWLQKALSSNLNATLEFIQSSAQIYMPLVQKNLADYHVSPVDQLQQAYKDCYIVFVLSSQGKQTIPLGVEDSIVLQNY